MAEQNSLPPKPETKRSDEPEVIVLEAHLEALRSLHEQYVANMRDLVRISVIVIGVLGIFAGVVAIYDINGRIANLVSQHIRENFPPDRLTEIYKEAMKERFVCTTLGLVRNDSGHPDKIKRHVIALDDAIPTGQELLLISCDQELVITAISVLRDYMIEGEPDTVTPQTFWLLVKMNNVGGEISKEVHRVFRVGDRKVLFEDKYSYNNTLGMIDYARAVRSFCEALKDARTVDDYCYQYP